VDSVTGNFQGESPLNPLAQQALLAAFESGWADPKKIGEHPSRAANLKNSAIESIASRLGLTPEQIEISGEVGLGYFLAIAGFLDPTKNQGTAIAQNSILSFQLANGETGAINSLPTDLPAETLIAVDATSSGARVPLPSKWDSAVFDSRSWAGPSGLAIVAIRNAAHWKNPLPHISSTRRTYGTYSLPLLLASAIALENFKPDDQAITNFNQKIRSAIKTAFPSAIIAGDLTQSLPHLISVIFPNTNGEEVLRALSAKGFAVDSGSACTAVNLQPSHVLAAMGLPTDGNIRITIHPDSKDKDVNALINALLDAVQSQQQR